MSDFRVYKTIHFKEEWANRITEMHHKQWNTTKGTYMYYDVLNMNYDPKHHFFILGLLDNNVIASCFVSTYEDYKNDECIFLLKDFKKLSLSSSATSRRNPDMPFSIHFSTTPFLPIIKRLNDAESDFTLGKISIFHQHSYSLG